MIHKGIFYDLGIPASEENANYLEKKIINIVGMNGHECSEIWSKVSECLDNPVLKERLRSKLAR